MSLLLAFAAAAGLPAVDGRGADTVMPRPAVMLFWASWCAPCQTELRALPELERSAAPLPVVIVPLTDPSALPAAVDRRKVRIPEGGGWHYLVALKLRPALPAAAIVDARGELCASHSGGIEPSKMTSLVAACGSVRK